MSRMLYFVKSVHNHRTSASKIQLSLCSLIVSLSHWLKLWYTRLNVTKLIISLHFLLTLQSSILSPILSVPHNLVMFLSSFLWKPVFTFEHVCRGKTKYLCSCASNTVTSLVSARTTWGSWIIRELKLKLYRYTKFIKIQYTYTYYPLKISSYKI